MIDFTQRVVVPEDTLMRELEGESVLLNLANEKYYGLNKVGTHMWAVLEKSANIQAAYDQLKTEYAVDPIRLRKDLETLIEKLVEQGLVKLEKA